MGRWCPRQFKDKEAWCIVAVQTLAVAEKRIKDLNTKLNKVDRERKSVEATLVGASSKLGKKENIFYPLALCIATPSSSQADSLLKRLSLARLPMLTPFQPLRRLLKNLIEQAPRVTRRKQPKKKCLSQLNFYHRLRKLPRKRRQPRAKCLNKPNFLQWPRRFPKRKKQLKARCLNLLPNQ